MKELDVLKESLKKAENFRAAASYISFDMATISPENAKPNEGELVAFLENEELKNEEGSLLCLGSSFFTEGCGLNE